MWECRQRGRSSSAREPRQLSLWKAACISSRLPSYGRGEYWIEISSRCWLVVVALKLWNLFAPLLVSCAYLGYLICTKVEFSQFQYQLDSDPFNNFLLPMKHYLDQTANTNCGKVRRIFLKSAEQYINEIYDWALLLHMHFLNDRCSIFKTT